MIPTTKEELEEAEGTAHAEYQVLMKYACALQKLLEEIPWALKRCKSEGVSSAHSLRTRVVVNGRTVTKTMQHWYIESPFIFDDFPVQYTMIERQLMGTFNFWFREDGLIVTSSRGLEALAAGKGPITRAYNLLQLGARGLDKVCEELQDLCP